jgi:LysM repeat protein
MRKCSRDFRESNKMASSIARRCEYAAATVAIVLGASCLLGACSSSLREDTTGSVSRPQTQVGSATPLPPVIHAPATTSAVQYTVPQAQTVAYTPQTCVSPATRRRYDVTASIPRARAKAQQRHGTTEFVVHTIAPHETLYSISRMYGTRVSDLATVNRMAENSRLRYGELLVVPTTTH